MEKYILTKSMHLGYVRESFGRGSVIVFYPDTLKLKIDGRTFEDYRDLEILKRHAEKNPQNPWIVPFTEETLSEILDGSLEPAPLVQKRDNDFMTIIQSDADLHDTIDISNTKISKINSDKREMQRQHIKDDGLDIIRGDESVEERIARLKTAKNTDLSARAERVKLLEKRAKMPIIRDDSLGQVGGSAASALNAGEQVSGNREVSERTIQAAERRKQEAEQRRIAMLKETQEEVLSESDSISKLQAEIARLQSSLESALSSKKNPVTDAAVAKRITGE
jgi:hypothetical protein